MAEGNDELMRLAADMRATEPDDKEGYLAKWIAFQERFVEVLPLYGNIYFDFFRPDLQSYNPNAHWGISSSLIYAYLGEPIEEEATEDWMEDSDGDEEFSDDGGFEIID